MKKSILGTNDFCPQTLFVFGTHLADGKPNFGLFCWLSYFWDGELGVMAAIGGGKTTRDRIKATKVFSANLVTEEMLPLADYFGNKNALPSEKIPAYDVEKGQVLDVPVLAQSPWVFELEVMQSIEMNDGEVFLCKVRNVLAEEFLTDETLSAEERINKIRPVSTTCMTYFNRNGTVAGNWGEPMKTF